MAGNPLNFKCMVRETVEIKNVMCKFIIIEKMSKNILGSEKYRTKLLRIEKMSGKMMKIEKMSRRTITN